VGLERVQLYCGGKVVWVAGDKKVTVIIQCHWRKRRREERGVEESEDELRGMTGGCCWILYEALGEFGGLGETLRLETEGGTEIEKIKIFLGGIWRVHGNC